MGEWQPWYIRTMPPKDARIEFKRNVDGVIHTCNVADIPDWWNVYGVYWRLAEQAGNGAGNAFVTPAASDCQKTEK